MIIYGAFDGSGFSLTNARALNITRVTMPIFWALHPDPVERAKRAAYLKSRGFRVVAHAGIYALYPFWPDSTADYDQRKARIAECRNALAPYVNVFDAVNEIMTHPVPHWPILFEASEHGKWQRRVNEFGGLLAGVRTGEFIEMLRGRATLYERIGVQCHVECDYATAQALLPGITANLDKLAAMGKPIDISEMSIPSTSTRFAGWTESRQASYLNWLMLLFKKHAAIESISWWELKDFATMYNPTSGLIRANGTRKPAFATWQELAR